METLIFTIIVLGLIICLFILKRTKENDEDFKYLIEPELKKFHLKLISSINPGRLKVGPFRKFNIKLNPLLINNGTIQYESTFYRKLSVQKPDKSFVTIWVKIETNSLTKDSIEFNPELGDIEV